MNHPYLVFKMEKHMKFLLNISLILTLTFTTSLAFANDVEIIGNLSLLQNRSWQSWR